MDPASVKTESAQPGPGSKRSRAWHEQRAKCQALALQASSGGSPAGAVESTKLAMLKGLESREATHARSKQEQSEDVRSAKRIHALAALLTGQSTQLVRKVIDHLTFTPGAKAKPAVHYAAMHMHEEIP